MSEQNLFAEDVGTWDADVTVRPAPGVPEQRSQGVSVQRLVGTWLVADFKNETSGFEGHGIYGFDATRKCFVGTWVDPMRPSLSVIEGSWDADKKTMSFSAEAKLPDGRVLKWTESTERPDENTRVFRQFFGDHEMMTVTYRRRA